MKVAGGISRKARSILQPTQWQRMNMDGGVQQTEKLISTLTELHQSRMVNGS